MRQTWTFRDAYQALAARQKPGAGVPFYTRVVNRRLGRIGGAAGAMLGLSPSAVSIAGGALWAVALLGLCLMPMSVPTVLVVFALLVISFGLDSADGQLARLTGRSSRAGEWLDHVLDCARHSAVHLSIAVALYRATDLPGPGRLALALPLLFAVVSTTRFFAQVLGEQLRDGGGSRQVPDRSPRASRGLVQLPADTGVLNACLLLLPVPAVFLVVYAVLAGANLLLLAATLRRRFIELAGVDAAAAAPRPAAQQPRVSAR
ncbi:CDP-alcohol phosphatidyltransferase family protein [Nocardioides sp. Iso805N]|uniref:CDP-alcohol phosphatidyltransferase family protein n=1 Tax=Nocardioides sp. Iso805N TaxID=1283287 RepID=UPI0003769721|nr:CDP-alcohol phosphatidyltransferase family protein [Nocardioides sp. Iso805N]